MRTAKIVEGEVNLRAVDVYVRVVGKSEANAVVDGEDEFAVGDVILHTLRSRQRGRELLVAAKAERCF